MRFCPPNKARRAALVSFVLLAFGVRSLIAPGFMPASDRFFSIEICPEGFPAQLLTQDTQDSMTGMDATMPGMDGSTPGMGASTPGAQSGPQHAPMQHGRSQSHMEHCVFGTSCVSGPPLQYAFLAEGSLAAPVAAWRFESAATVVRFVYLPHSRGPPAAA